MAAISDALIDKPLGAASTRPRVMIVACEASADVQAAAVIRTLKAEADLEVVAVGGSHVCEVADRLLADSSKWGAIGVWEAFPRAPGIAIAFLGIRRAIRDLKPDLLVVVDCPAINLPLVDYARKQGVRTVYYFPPSQWTENLARHRHIAERVDDVIVAFGFTADRYREAGVPAAFFGHPLMDLLQDTPRGAAARHALGLPESGPVVGLLPGSRTQEVRMLLPILIEAARLMQQKVPEVRFALPVAMQVLRPFIEAEVRASGLPVTIVDGQSRTVMAACDVLLMCSGTATLEAAILGTPMVIGYRLPRFDYTLGRLLGIRVRWMGLPNLVLQRLIVPELLQHEFNATRLADEGLALLCDPEKRRQMKDSLATVQKNLGNLGVVAAVAHFILERMALGPTRHRHHHQ
ncbi:MAG: lipid-A-disaccharide synthase [Candidatus Xenobia bacterium]